MFKKSLRSVKLISVVGFLLVLFAIPSFAVENRHLAIMYTIKGDAEAKYNTLVEEKIKSIDFRLSDPHKRVNDAYKKKYGSTKLDILSFMSVSNEKVVKPMFNVDPRIAGFAPFNMLIYKKLDENVTKVGHLMPEAMLDIIGISDPKLRADYIKSFEPLDKMIKEELGGEVSYIDFENMAEQTMMNFEVEFDAGTELEDVIDDFQMEFEEKFEENKYIIAGYLNLKETDGEDTIPGYDAFWSYSLCHFKFSYTVFDNEGGRPEAGLFAPCTMYMYIKKGTNKIVVGMPRLENWGAMLGIKDKARADLIKQLDTEIPTIMKELGAIETDNVNPLLAAASAPKKEVKAEEKPAAVKEQTPKASNNIVKKAAAVAVATAVATAPLAAGKEAPVKESTGVQKATIAIPAPPKPVKAMEVVTVGGGEIKPREHKTLSTEIPQSVTKPAHATTLKEEKQDGSLDVGMNKNGRVPAYLRGSYMELSEVKKSLEGSGFRVIAASAVDKKELLTTVVFTNAILQNLANKKERGFMGSLRLLIDNDNKQITITNPLYFSRAFMQDDHDEKAILGVLNAINSAFGGLKASKDNLKYTLLPKYQFMFAMPYYKDMIEVGEASSSQALLQKIKAKNGGKNLIFAQELSKDKIIIGVKLGKRTSKFIGKIGTENALLLPYPILLENGVAKILDPKYYIAISYPMLKMSQFMKISTVPGAIQNDCEKFFK